MISMNSEPKPFNTDNTFEIKRLESTLEAAGIGSWDLDLYGKYFRINDRFKSLINFSCEDRLLFGQFLVLVHIEDRQRVAAALEKALATPLSQTFEIKFRISEILSPETRWLGMNGKTYCNAQGKLDRFCGILSDVTSQVREEQPMEESRLQLLNSFEQAPVGIAILRGTELKFTMINPFFARLVGREQGEMIGKPLGEALPELKDQGFEKILNDVFSTGLPYISKEEVLSVCRDGHFEVIYMGLTCQPQAEKDGTISGILIVATDITEQVLARQKIQEAESSLRGAIELAGLGTLEMDIRTGALDFSPRLREWFGIDQYEPLTLEKAFAHIEEPDREEVRNAFTEAGLPNGTGTYDVTFSVIPANGPKRILHAQGKAFANDKAEIIKLSGSVQDITQQREIRLALEHQVTERTEALIALNEELGAINEEYLATNEELAESNHLLLQSNQNLQQFAYVASHDLQEPLRKIQSFGNLLMNRYGEQLGEGSQLVNRMQTAANRMSVLIYDLLAFSRISTKTDVTEPVSLTEVIKSVLTDLEISIHESQGIIRFDPLPVIEGDKSQLGQLFQNLISNALKFRRPDAAPFVEISYEKLPSSALPLSAKPTRPSAYYYRVEVKDNGIGFEQQYADRIFQLFQRLHGRSEFAGTGIGLAICEKVATNHGGDITASSIPGQGSIFSVYFPV
jgi:PAS domain S-box-containing protein